MTRRLAIIPILCVAALALAGGTAAVAKHRPPPKPQAGTYSGTTSDGIDISIVLNPGRATGTISYCSLSAPITVSGKSFAVEYQDPVGGDSISASGTFKAKRKRSGKVHSSVLGMVGPNGCDSTPQTFALRH